MEAILVTAFEPFGGDAINPTEMILDKLPDRIGGCEIRKLLLPVEFGRAAQMAVSEYDMLGPSAVIMLGQAGGRSAITPETTAKNIMNASIPDNAGYRPDDQVIVQNGPEELHSTFDAAGLAEAIKAAGIAGEVSHDAGAYVCNALLYGMLYHNKGRVPTGFIHVPFIKEQGHDDKPFMEFDDMYKGLDAAIRTVLSQL